MFTNRPASARNRCAASYRQNQLSNERSDIRVGVWMEIGVSGAVLDGDWIFISGTTGFDYAPMTISDHVVAQAEQCLLNIEKALSDAGSRFADVVRVRYILPRVED